MPYWLREITEADYAWLYALKRETMRRYVEETWGTWEDEFQEEFFRKNFSLETIRAIVFEGRDVGLLHVERKPDEIFLANIQLMPAFQNRGLGTAIMRDLLAEAKQRRVPLRLQVLKTNAAARRLYERLGFRLHDETFSHWQLQA